MKIALKPASEPATLEWWCVGLVALPISVFLASEALLALLGPHAVGETGKLCGKATTACTFGLRDVAEVGSRTQLLAIMLLYFAFATCILLKFAWDLMRFCETTRWKLIVAYGACVLAGLSVLALVEEDVFPRTVQFLGVQRFTCAFSRAVETAYWSECIFSYVLRATNILTALTVPALVTGGISCLPVFCALSHKDSWRVQTERLKTYIYMSAGFLVLGVMYFKSWTGYPAFALEGRQLENFVAGVNALTMYTGIEYSIILAAYSLPVAWVLAERADRIAKDALTQNRAGEHGFPPSPSAVRKVREEEGLVFPVRDSLEVVVALLAPLIAGALPSLAAALG